MGSTSASTKSRPLSSDATRDVWFHAGPVGRRPAYGDRNAAESSAARVSIVLGDTRVRLSVRRDVAVRSASYRRGLEYVPGLRAAGVRRRVHGCRRRPAQPPVGRCWRRPRYSDGESALSRERRTFDTYTGNVDVRYALTPAWAVYVEYLYYYYDFRGTAHCRPVFRPSLERNGVRVGLTLWVPVTRR